jgi:ESCRT-II complex subunit VPS36
VRALLATHNEGVQPALDWILAYGDTPGVDDPLEGEGPPGGGAGGAPSRSEGGGGGGMGGAPPGAGLPRAGPLSTGAAAMAEARRQWQGQRGGGGSGGLLAGGGGSGGAPLSGASVGVGSFSNPLLAPAGAWGGADGRSGSSGSLSAATGAGGSASSSGVGIAGLMAREQSKAALTGRALDAAFSDLRALMAAAADMVELAERFKAAADPGASGASGTGEPPGGSLDGVGGGGAGGSGGGGGGLDAATADALVAMGIVSPVTRASAGAMYHTQLARQLSDFLEAPLRRTGGLMMLPDVYCIFNRARGTELVSPDDLVTAAGALEGLGLPLRLRRFESGVVVVQSAEHTDAALVRRVRELLDKEEEAATAAAGSDGGEGGSGGAAGAAGAAAAAAAGAPALGPPLSASAVGVALGLPLALAREALLVAEAAGALCRDDGPEGLRFFRNFFAAPEAAAAVGALAAR